MPKKKSHQKEQSVPHGRRRSRLGREFLTSLEIGFPFTSEHHI